MNYRILKFFSPDPKSYSGERESLTSYGRTVWNMKIYDDGSYDEYCVQTDSAYENVDQFETQLKKVYKELGVKFPWEKQRKYREQVN